MTLLRMTAREFVTTDQDVLRARFRLAHLYKTIGDDPDRKLNPSDPPPGDLESWCESVVDFARVLVDAKRPDLVILVEYQIPNIVLPGGGPVRIDALVCGREPVLGDPRYLVVELKRWDEAQPVVDAADRVAVPGFSDNKEHPAVQSSRYKWMAMDEVDQFAAFEVDLPAIAYLHNAKEAENRWLKSLRTAKPSWVVLHDDKEKLAEFVRKTFTEESGDYAADVLRDSRAKHDATTTLTNSADVLAGNMPFALTPLQRDGVKKIVEAAVSTEPHVIFVQGGPGTGKSVVTLQALSQLHKMGKRVRLVTASTAYREALKKSLREKGMRHLSSLLATTADLRRLEEPLDVVLFDEAQRMSEYPSRTLPLAERVNENRSIHIVLRSARVVCFAMDVGQVVRAAEQNDQKKLQKLASSAQMRKARLYNEDQGGFLDETAVKEMAEIKKIHLHDRFRAGGTGNYEIWVERLLAPAPGPVRWVPGERFRLHVAESPQWMQNFLEERIKDGLRARMVAGFCWKWTTHGNPGADGLATDHVHLKTGEGVWSYPWNAHKRTADAPESTRWAIDDQFGFGQIGCVFTCHGLEFDWVGVIIGPDLVWRGDRWESRRHWHKDGQTVRGVPVAQKDQKFDELVRNAYRILLTRGLRGAVLYSADDETRLHLAGLVAGITSSDQVVA